MICRAGCAGRNSTMIARIVSGRLSPPASSNSRWPAQPALLDCLSRFLSWANHSLTLTRRAASPKLTAAGKWTRRATQLKIVWPPSNGATFRRSLMSTEGECMVFRQKKLVRFGMPPIGMIVLMLMFNVESDISDSMFRGVAITVVIVCVCVILPWWTVIRLKPDVILSRGVLGCQRVPWTDVDRVDFKREANGLLRIMVFTKGRSGHRRPKIVNFGVFEKSEQLQRAVESKLKELAQ